MTENGEKKLGRLQRVDLREIWASEAQGFTPWLAEEENLAVLAETIGLELELQAQEQNVGPFRADILCKDTVDNHWVLIENQLERTDHTHLGQLMTYAAGLDAVTIVWVASRFTDEHRAAIDWVNRITEEGINFFGLEIELWQIGNSPIAAKFNIVSKPNDWRKTIRDQAKSELTETKQMQLAYWTAFRQLMEDSSSFVRCQSPHPQHWACFAIGRAWCQLVAKVNTRAKDIAVYLCLQGPDRTPHYHLLHDGFREKVEGSIQMPLEWRELPDAKESQLITYMKADPADRRSWPRQHEWMKKTLETFHRVLGPIIKGLDATEYDPDASAG
ncbi:MAG: DUF4268 domain-containing protein [Nitrospiraceae bacterium]|nr:DUF4268 domain-containing protein [Nitrospiraceae bacterium]